MHVLYIATSGSSDPTRASIPLHLAVNGSLEAGDTVAIVLAGDATEAVKAGTREAMEGVGLPAARELWTKAVEHQVPVYV